MTDQTAEREAQRSTWRRKAFRTWIIATVVAAAVIMLVVPFGPYLQDRFWGVGLIVIPILLIMLFSGLAWLVYRVTRRPRQH
ncbi:MAG: hypothetical protein GVY13_11020 [Alphaproteobacteria bacterium]|jgi:type III secretory pathway component EscV|nr:hypothetical protein [Alphaproteobacteria bacterium]